MTIFQIRIQGSLDGHWSDWFDGMAVTDDGNGNTVLSGPLADQAALHGVLGKIHDLGLTLISVSRVTHEATGDPRDPSVNPPA